MRGFYCICIIAGCESNRLDDVGEKRKQVKQKLLEEMLRQKHELERKQAERLKVRVFTVSFIMREYCKLLMTFIS